MRLSGWPFVLGVVLALGTPAMARADGDAGTVLAIDEPRSQLHLDLPGGCQVRPTEGAGAACASFAASAFQSERFAVVQQPNGLLSYSVALFTSKTPGRAEERARKVLATMGETATGTPSVVIVGPLTFLRVELTIPTGAALCFVTVDDRPEVTAIMFASEPGARDTMMTNADAVMRSVRRVEPEGASPTATPQPMSRTAQVLITAFLALVFGLPMVRFIRRAAANAKNAKKRSGR